MKYLLVLLVLLFGHGLSAQCSGNLVLNGSFTGAEGGGTAAPDWDGVGTPDVNDANGPLVTTSPEFNWVGTPLPSTDGGTWQNLCSSFEHVFQTVAVVPGQHYKLCFEYANQPIASSFITYDEPGPIVITLDGSVSYLTPIAVSPYTWEAACFDFIATSTTVTLEFAPESDLSYMAIDGVCLVPIADSPLTACALLEMPNTFTPNGDGINDRFVPKNSLAGAELLILNRWGQTVYSSTYLQGGWDGTAAGTPCTEGVYFWIVRYAEGEDNVRECHGFVTLWR